TNVSKLDRNRERSVVFYGRVSTEHEAQLAALENQMQWYEDQAKYHPNWTVLKQYIDRGITGTQAKKRPAFMEMLEDARHGKFDLIVTREVCRFARNTVDTLVITRQLKEIGIEVYFVEDNIWTMDNDGELRLTIMATLAQEESRKTSERVRAGQKISRDNGVLYGNGNILGYDRLGDTYVINEEQAETVRIIYDLYLKVYGFTKIVNELVRLKRKDSSGLVRWEATKVSRILHNATYKGYQGYYKSYKNNHLDQKTVINRDEDSYLYVKGKFTPIISEEVWEKCRAIRESKIILRRNKEGKLEKSGTNPSEDIWAKRLRCRCGYHMRKDRWHMSKRGITYGYKCYNRLNNGSKQARIDAGLDAENFCDMTTIADWKFDLMLFAILEVLNLNNKDLIKKTYEKFKSLYRKDIKEVKGLKEAEAKLRRIQIKLENLTEMRVNGEINKQEFTSLKAKINGEMLVVEKEIDDIKQAVHEEEKMTNPLISLETFSSLVVEDLDFSKPLKHSTLVDAIVKKIVPETTHDFKWYLNMFPKGEGCRDEDYTEIMKITIDYEMAQKFKTERGSVLRPNHWKDIVVRIMT
ncbi:MAG: recombinase family protein, partial [Candidatus Coproplasma sp.]